MNTRHNHRVAIIVPTTVNVNESAAPDAIAKWTRAAKVKLADLFGGFTAYQAIGGWMSPAHGLVEEPVTVVSSFTDEPGLDRLGAVRAFAAEMGVALHQEAVAVEVDNGLELVPPLKVVAA